MNEASTGNQALDCSIEPAIPEIRPERAGQVQTIGRPQASPYALFIIGFDHFERINAGFGYSVGDQLLNEVASRLQKIRGVQRLCRIGGAEFVVALPVASQIDAAGLACEILKEIHRPFEVAEFRIGLVPRIGAAFSQEHEVSSHLLLQRARLALSMARKVRREFFFYDPNEDEIESKKAALINDLRGALSNDQLFLLYQPKIDLTTGQAAGVEALLRWQHPELGLIAPDRFIPLAEETGLITQLTDSVFHKVLRQCRAWNYAGMETKIATNVSMWDLQEEGFSDRLPALLAQYGVAPSQLALEITETALMTRSSRAIETLQRLRKMGLWISIDDFGTGHSSLAYVKNLPVNEIKIDQTFVRNMSADKTDSIIVESVIDLAHKLGLNVVAEGVEDGKTQEMLKTLNCDAAQGYYLSEPISPVEFKTWLDRRDQTPALPHAAANANETWMNRVLDLNGL